jgi:hypothetical protein
MVWTWLGLCSEGEKNTRAVSWIVLTFSCFLIYQDVSGFEGVEKLVKIWLLNRVFSGIKANRKRENNTKLFYTGSSHNIGVVQSPCISKGVSL